MKKDRKRQNLLLKNGRKFKKFMSENSCQDYSYEITRNLENIKDKNLEELESDYDKQLKEYLFEHFQYFFSLSMKQQFDILSDRFEWILHEPTMFLVDRALYQDPARNPYLLGNFAPVHDENEAYIIDNNSIRGIVPKDISGVYLRNGPNPKFIPSNGRQHWFDGDSMIHAIRIKNGELQYSNKYTMTDKLKEELKHNKPIVMRVGELQSGKGF